MLELRFGKLPEEHGCDGKPSFHRALQDSKPANKLDSDSGNTQDYASRRHYLPLESRQQNYENVKARIFGESNSENPNPTKNTSKKEKSKIRIMKLRKYQKENRMRKRIICDAIERFQETKDPRPYVSVKIEGKEVKGLLDSGATVSLLGKQCREIAEELNLQIFPYVSAISTASGQRHRILGKIIVNIEYKDKTREIILYLCPDLQQDLYLGTDFWRLFEIAPEIFSLEEVNLDLQIKIHGESKNANTNMHDLTEDQKIRLSEVVSKFYTFEEKGLGCTSLEKHAIKLIEGANPVKDKHYPLSPAVQDIVYKEIDNMLALKVIEESDSPWSNRTTVVRKPGKNRFCLDARKLNALTIKDAYPLQNIDGILSRIDQTHYISSVDLKYAFWQIELEEEARPYTAFTVPGRPLYQFRVMPFGLCNAAQRLCRLMDKVIPGRLKSNVFIYLDDLLIIADDFDNHLRLLSEVADCLRKANLTIGMKKSLFCFRELKYLGFIIGNGCLKTDPDKISAILNIPVPRSPREVRSFLGTAGWYRRFIKNFASISAPLTDTLKKGQKFNINAEAMESFKTLKKALTSAPVLRHPDFRREFFIQCDASEYGIGAVLFQKDDDGGEKKSYQISA